MEVGGWKSLYNVWTSEHSLTALSMTFIRFSIRENVAFLNVVDGYEATKLWILIQLERTLSRPSKSHQWKADWNQHHLLDTAFDVLVWQKTMALIVMKTFKFRWPAVSHQGNIECQIHTFYCSEVKNWFKQRFGPNYSESNSCNWIVKPRARNAILCQSVWRCCHWRRD